MSATTDAARITPLKILPRSYFRNLFVQQDDALILLDRGDSREKAEDLWKCLNTFEDPCDHIEDCVITDSFYESKALCESFDQITASQSDIQDDCLLLRDQLKKECNPASPPDPIILYIWHYSFNCVYCIIFLKKESCEYELYLLKSSMQYYQHAPNAILTRFNPTSLRERTCVDQE
jgi:hypothetical protein